MRGRRHDVVQDAPTSWRCTCGASGSGYRTAEGAAWMADAHAEDAYAAERGLVVTDPALDAPADDPLASAPLVGTAGRDEDCPL